ncbi:MAG: PEGA domain-containing protein [Bdellovibrionales bacterium]|nr:PEGA domain-containing protein [Bdellovibrionales bacterium]
MKYIFLFFSLIANAADEPPKWVTNPSNSDDKYFYGFGMAESENESTAFSEADKNAESDLIQNAFGASFQVSTQMNSDSVAVSLKKTLASESNQVLTRNIQRDQIYKDRSKRSLYKIYVLKKIDKQIAETFANEKIQSLSKSHFESNPVGATVTVDGKTLGSTPLTALLPSGSYKIKMSLNGYKQLSEN